MNRADPWRIGAARRLRREATDAERRLWRELRDWPAANWRRQHPLAGFILDFYSEKAKLAIELDGGGHFEPEGLRRDSERDAGLAQLGVLVQRYDDATVLESPESVAAEIWRSWQERVLGQRRSVTPHPSPPPPEAGEGARDAGAHGRGEGATRNAGAHGRGKGGTRDAGAHGRAEGATREASTGAGRFLCLNVGSSSIKWSLIAPGEQTLQQGELAFGGESAIDLSSLPTAGVTCVVHRLVHGGSRFRGPTRIDATLRAALEELRPLDPDHLPRALAGIAAAEVAFPKLPQVACFDTAFHAGLPAGAYTYAVPRTWTEGYGVRRYGFHGLSVAYAVRRTRELLGASPDQLLVCHLGSGSSITAVRDGESCDTSMGFTPLEGLPMSTRSGSIDPAIALYLQRERGLSAEAVDRALQAESGLRGLFGDGDLRAVLAAVDNGEARAQLAYAVFLTGVRRGFGAMLASLDAPRAVVFTGGIGEHQPRVRAEVLATFGWTGLTLDPQRNAAAHGDAVISPEGGPIAVLCVTAREDLTMAREAAALLGATSA